MGNPSTHNVIQRIIQRTITLNVWKSPTTLYIWEKQFNAHDGKNASTHYNPFIQKNPLLLICSSPAGFTSWFSKYASYYTNWLQWNIFLFGIEKCRYYFKVKTVNLHHLPRYTLTLTLISPVSINPPTTPVSVPCLIMYHHSLNMRLPR